MKVAALIARILLGLAFVVFSANYFFNFFTLPAPGGAAGEFMGALLATGYLFTFMKIIELVSGILLLAGVLVPLALTLLAPIIVNIFLFHAFLEPSGLPLAIVLVVLEIFLAWAYRGSFKGVLDPKARPA